MISNIGSAAISQTVASCMVLPGTASGSIASRSAIALPRSFQRTAASAVNTPAATASSIARNEYLRLLKILGITILLESAFSKWSRVKCSGSTVPYQRSENAVKSSARCGSAAASVTTRNAAPGSARRHPASGVAELPEDVERARTGSRSAEPAALELRSRKIFHLRHQFAGRLGRRPGGGDAGYAQKENKFAEALQFRFDNCLSLQR